jgi:hypothetical protein
MAVGYNGIRISIAKITPLALIITYDLAPRQLA